MNLWTRICKNFGLEGQRKNSGARSNWIGKI